MLFLKKIRSNISKYWPYFFLPLVVLYISSYAFDGNNGLMAHARLDAEIIKLEKKIAEFERNNDLLRVKISLIENEMGQDLIDQEIRSVLGYGENNEYIIYFD